MSALTDRLAEIEGRAGAATPGPWGVNSEVGSNELCNYTVYGIPGVASATWTGDDSPAFAHCEGMSRADAEFIAAARTDVPALVAALRGVLEMHQPVEIEPSDTICGECSYRLPNGRYFGKVEYWPCPTVRAITEALGVEL